MSRATLRCEMSNPILSSSPWMRGAPQRGFASAMVRTRSASSEPMGGRPVLPRRDFQVQKARKPSRCQRITVSGRTTCSASRHRRPGYKFHPRGRCKTRPVIDLLRFVSGLAADLVRRRVELVAENALLRQQLIVAERKLARRVRWTPWQRFTIVLASRVAPAWREATLLIRPATILRWHRAGFRAFWRRRSRRSGRPPLARGALIREMAGRNPRWGAERIRGELLKLGIPVCKRTIQRYLPPPPPPAHPPSSPTFPPNHAPWP